MTIIKLKETNGNQVRRLLEANGITIVQDTKQRFDIICPECEKKEAFIDYKSEKHRWIKCNRAINCGYNIGLWELISSKQCIDSKDNRKMLEYINNTIGQDFMVVEKKDTLACAVEESSNEDQEFLTHCNQIFKNAFKPDTDEVQVSWDYMRDRGYSYNHIKAFNLGYLPNSTELLETLTTTPYSYSKLEVNKLITKYFEGIFKWNEGLAQREESRNRIIFTWYDKNNNVAGFSLRKPTSKDVPMKYVFNKEAPKSRMLFNINNWNKKDSQKIVIVEGTLDALAASYLSSAEVQTQYHFVAMGSNIITQGQAELLSEHNISEVILLIDNDKAGAKYPSSIRKLEQYNITSSIARIPEKYKNIKDIDELLRKYPDNEEINIMNILEEAKIETEQESVAAIEIQQSIKPEEDLQKKEIVTQISNELQSAENIIDVYEINKRLCGEKLQNAKNELEEALKQDNLGTIASKVIEYNKLKTQNTTDDKAYSASEFVQDITTVKEGLKTGFYQLDQETVIEEGTITMVAGRPSHGKTTVMLNMYRNMIMSNSDKSFLFYSYEENKVDILSKIIIGLAKFELMTNESFKSLRESKTNDSTGGVQVTLIPNKEDGKTYWQLAKEVVKKEAALINQNKLNTILESDTPITRAIKMVMLWMKEGRMQILSKKTTVERLSNSIIEKAIESSKSTKEDPKKPIGAVFIDYTQKLKTEEERVNRQQELQRVCSVILDTSLDKRVKASIILGSQVNREVISLSTLTADKMREAGDIEQDANLIIAVWDEKAAKITQYQSFIEGYEKRIIEYTINDKPKDVLKFKQKKDKAEKHIQELQNEGSGLVKILKILKNRNGGKDIKMDVINHPAEFLLIDRKNDSISMQDRVLSDFK